MQLELQHADPQADPHDAIVAQLRKLAAPIAHDPAEIKVTPASPEPAGDPSSLDIPLNDNSGDIRNPARHTRSGRGVVLLVACAGITATVAWHSYGEEAKQRFSSLVSQSEEEMTRGLSHIVPQLLAGVSALTQSASTAKPQDAASQTAPQPAADPAPAQEAVAAPAPPAQPATAAATPAVNTPSPQAALPPEVAQSIETMTREIASLKQTVEQLQVGQQQLGRDVAKVTELEARRKLVAQAAKPAQRVLGAPPRNLGTLPPSSPSPAYSQGQTYPQGAAYTSPSAPAQLPPPPGDASVPRPPASLR